MQDNNKSSNIISKETVIEGNISTSGNLRIEGKVLGNINTQAKIVLGESSITEGSVIAQNAEIAGCVEGTLQIDDLLILKPNAIVNGDISTHKLIFEKGAQFNGKCNMVGDIELREENKIINEEELQEAE